VKLHFFTANNIEDYRKNYNKSDLARKLFNKFHPQKLEDFDQGFFFHLLKDIFQVPEGIYESRIYGDTGFPGLRLDFNFGLRLDIPEGNFRVRISDLDNERVVFDKYISGGRLLSVEHYFIRWKVEVFLDEEKIFSHTLNLEGQPVTIMYKFCALGDTIAFLPYFREFKKRHKCNLSVCLPDYACELFAQLYPDIPLVDEVDFKTYATYYMAMLMSPFPLMPVDTRHMSMDKVAGTLLGIDYLPPKGVFQPTAPPVTNEPYVCIAVHSRNARKCWHYPKGWDIVIDYLKSLGYRVFCIDKELEINNDNFTIRKPDGAEDFTGNHPLIERANMLYHAEFFIGMSSGLSWIAHSVDCPVVMICGFSQDWFEFYTPYRVANRRVCNGCFNDYRATFLTASFCHYHKDTSRELECQKKITPRMVIEAIERLIVDKNLTPPALKNL